MKAPMLGITIPDAAPPTRCMNSFIFFQSPFRLINLSLFVTNM
jgi:hypothetical protein